MSARGAVRWIRGAALNRLPHCLLLIALLLNAVAAAASAGCPRRSPASFGPEDAGRVTPSPALAHPGTPAVADLGVAADQGEPDLPAPTLSACSAHSALPVAVAGGAPLAMSRGLAAPADTRAAPAHTDRLFRPPRLS